MSAEIFSQQSFQLKMVRQTRNNATGCTILLDQNIARPITGSWCKKKLCGFCSLLEGFAKGNESWHCIVRCFLRIMILKVYRYKFSQQNGDFLK